MQVIQEVMLDVVSVQKCLLGSELLPRTRLFTCFPPTSAVAVLSRRWSMAGYAQAIFERLSMQIFTQPFCAVVWATSPFFQGYFAVCSFLPKMLHSFYFILSEISSARYSFDCCVVRENA